MIRKGERKVPEQSKMEISLFSGMTILWNGTPILEHSARLNKPLELLALLLLRGDKKLTNEQLMDGLWESDEIENPAGALKNAPPMFPPGFTCPAVLWIQLAAFSFRLRDYHSLWCAVPCTSAKIPQCRLLSVPRRYCYLRFGLFRVRSPLLTESRLISFPRPT